MDSERRTFHVSSRGAVPTPESRPSCFQVGSCSSGRDGPSDVKRAAVIAVADRLARPITRHGAKSTPQPALSDRARGPLNPGNALNCEIQDSSESSEHKVPRPGARTHHSVRRRQSEAAKVDFRPISRPSLRSDDAGSNQQPFRSSSAPDLDPAIHHAALETPQEKPSSRPRGRRMSPRENEGTLVTKNPSRERFTHISQIRHFRQTPHSTQSLSPDGFRFSSTSPLRVPIPDR